MHNVSSAQWYKDAVIYELHVRSFADSSGDGIGDFRGLTERLGYFEELGVTALWLLPFYPSPLRDDGYDIADYMAVNPSYGTLEDFQEFLAEAHKRNLKVITELVINHTSDQHAWFQRARRAPVGSAERDFYVWSDNPRKFEEARIIFKDFESSNWAWDPVAKAYYWHRFYSHQPDLNFDSPHVQQAVFEVLDFWLKLGVDGLRLDAIPYLFEREGTSCENLPETHAYLRKLRRHVEENYAGRMLLAEANQWPEDAVAYFGQGDECHMSFHFPLMPRIFMSVQMEDRFPIIDILEQTPEIPAECQWAIFLRNHDELTLEMVTDEERDYMYRLYAEDPRARINLGIRRRLAPLLDNNRRKIELVNSLLLSLPGTPIIYYGDEIGMGDNFYLGDRNGVRTPMQWSADRNAGFSRANPQQLFLPVIIDPEFHYEAVNVDVHMKNLSSLFWWMRRVVDARKRHPAFSHGTLEFLRPDNAKVLTFLRRDADEVILVVANLSRFSQCLELDLSEFKGSRAEEMFGGGVFFEIKDAPVTFTVGPHGFYWLLLKSTMASKPGAEAAVVPEIALAGEWSEGLIDHLETAILPGYLSSCRWYGQKDRILRLAKVRESFADPSGNSRIILLELTFTDGDPMTQILALAIGAEDAGDVSTSPAMVARFTDGRVLWDLLYTPEGRGRIWDMLTGELRWGDSRHHLRGIKGDGISGGAPASRVLGGEQSNTALAYGDEWMFKFFRIFTDGPHPDAEILRVLSERGFPYSPRFGGEIRCRLNDEEGAAGLLTSFVKNQGDGWSYMLDAVGRFFEQVVSVEVQAEATGQFDEIIEQVIPQRAQQLGQRTAALHACLASVTELPEFAPEAVSSLYQRSLYQTMRSQLRRTEVMVTRKLPSLPAESREVAISWLATTPRILDSYQELLRHRVHLDKIRVHGDYHLGQVLNTGNDFVILDFEGEPRRSLGERRLKKCSLVDVAGMMRSFDYAVQVSLNRQKPEDRPRLKPWAERWLGVVSKAFLDGYRSEAGDASFLPASEQDFQFLLLLFLLDKSVYEIGYELNYRPDFLSVPMGAGERLLNNRESKV
ncbi:maltose alpha-D-glucosyltransferase [Terrimicrobium sacchariphilum]|uniref:maltose alpha-D-glucosyltransferase n=1 Tax=Terrimicrobium sacchariphilum TaxID=690879 RepID=A0A146G8R3_TERSA|nr:maltose alpha-D-glucosyltransferase [Terrimicrobium sacchariphilum]GAT33900.1 maltose alpha-D-glucosyltransferase [Terrimicrobium sacchariphilum]